MLYGTDGHCKHQGDDWTRAGCTTFRGGAYDWTTSRASKSATSDNHPVDGQPYPAMDYVSDTLAVGNNTLLDFPLGIAKDIWGEQAYTPLAALGLGSNSTFLNVLKNSGKIASRTYSLFWGQTGRDSDAQLDGSIVFGGYDRAKVGGSKFTTGRSPDPSCPSGLLVTMRDITLNFPNGTDMSIFDGSKSTAITACINPTLPVFMRIPLKPYVETFLKISSDGAMDIYKMNRATGMNWWNLRYPPGVKT